MRFGIGGLTVGAALCVLNTAIAAEDVKQTILLLPDEAAECRYIASLAQQADAAFASAKSLRAEGQTLEASGQIKSAAQKNIAASMAAQKFVLDSALNVTAGIAQMKIKHPTLPSCAEPFDAPAQQRVKEIIGFAKETADHALELSRR